jgi:spermidine synthase
MVWLLVLPTVNRWSNSLWYQQVHKLPPQTITLFSGYSPYQKVDVLQDPSGQRYLYLDGLNHFGFRDGERLNVLMGQIPAGLAQPEQVLVFGAGSMQMEQMIALSAGHVTTVELDPLMVAVSEKYFLEANQMDRLPNRTVIIDDAKHFIAITTTEYDMIATDLPAAFSIQTAVLYSQPFFQAIAQHLKPNGFAVINLTGEFKAENTTPRRIAAGLLQVFDEVLVIQSTSAGWSFAYAGEDLPFSRTQLENALRASGELEYVILETGAVRRVVGEAEPITLDSLEVAFYESAAWIAGRLR